MTLNDQLNECEDLTTQKQTLWERMRRWSGNGEYLRRYQDYNRTSLSISTSNSAALCRGRLRRLVKTQKGTSRAEPGLGSLRARVSGRGGGGLCSDHELWQGRPAGTIHH